MEEKLHASDESKIRSVCSLNKKSTGILRNDSSTRIRKQVL